MAEFPQQMQMWNNFGYGDYSDGYSYYPNDFREEEAYPMTNQCGPCDFSNYSFDSSSFQNWGNYQNQQFDWNKEAISYNVQYPYQQRPFYPPTYEQRTKLDDALDEYLA